MSCDRGSTLWGSRTLFAAWRLLRAWWTHDRVRAHGARTRALWLEPGSVIVTTDSAVERGAPHAVTESCVAGVAPRTNDTPTRRAHGYRKVRWIVRARDGFAEPQPRIEYRCSSVEDHPRYACWVLYLTPPPEEVSSLSTAVTSPTAPSPTAPSPTAPSPIVSSMRWRLGHHSRKVDFDELEIHERSRCGHRAPQPHASSQPPFEPHLPALE